MKITITGHRPGRLPKNQENAVYEWLKSKFLEYNPEEVITGMAQGVDQIAAWVCKDYGWNFIGYYAFKKSLSPVEEHLLESGYCGGAIYLKDAYAGPGDYIERDKKMVDDGDIVLAVWDGLETGGTWQTIKYAKKIGKKIEIYMIKKETTD